MDRLLPVSTVCFLLMLTFLELSLADDKKVKTNGNIIFGGLFPMHEKGPSGTSCGNLKEEKGIQRMEAMMYAVDKINADDNLLPNITIGVHILDTCSRDTYALEQSMDFIKSKISSLDSTEYECANGTRPIYTPSKPVVGVIGAASSSVSIMVANILRLFKIPQISYASTSSELSDDSRFGYFSRVVPPDTFQAQAMADVIKALGWTYVSTLADEGNYGEKGIAAFEEEATSRGICVAKSIKIPREADGHFFNETVATLLKQEKAKVVVMFVNEDNCRRLLAAAKVGDDQRTLNWLASDSWGAKIHPVEGQEEAALGAITILPKRKVLKGFDAYFTSRTLGNNARNPWFYEFWQTHFKCSINMSQAEKEQCTGEERISSETSGYEQEGLVQFVVDAVYALAYAIHGMVKTKCSSLKLCSKFKDATGEEVLHSIRNVSFKGAGETLVQFNEVGDGFGRYNVFQFQKSHQGDYRYVAIGEWTGSLNINISQARWKNGTHPPKSICSEPCPVGHMKKMTEACCWICVPCGEFEILTNETQCTTCQKGTVPSKDKTVCQPLPILHMEWDTPAAIIPLIVAGLGVILTTFVLAVFIKYNSTPLVMASARELCFVILAGIMMSFLITVPMLSPPSPGSCAVLRAGLGMSLAMCYAGMLTKTNRISRIFNRTAKNMMKRPQYTSPKSQLVICSILVSVQIVGVAVWMFIDAPNSIKSYPDRYTVILRCKASEMTLIISLAYDMILIIMCTVYAIKTRKIPENFNEAKYIAFTMYSTCIVWVAFVPIYFSTGSSFMIQITTLSVCTSISAYVVLFCLFLPKVYIILFAPHKNVRPSSLTTSLKGFGSSFHAKSFTMSVPKDASSDANGCVDGKVDGAVNHVPKSDGKIRLSSDFNTDFEDSGMDFTDVKMDLDENSDDVYEASSDDRVCLQSCETTKHDSRAEITENSPINQRRHVSVSFSVDSGRGRSTEPLLRQDSEMTDVSETSKPPDIVVSNFDSKQDGGKPGNHVGRSSLKTRSPPASPGEYKKVVRVSFSDDAQLEEIQSNLNGSYNEHISLLPQFSRNNVEENNKGLKPHANGSRRPPSPPNIDKEVILGLNSLKESFC